MPIIWAQPYSTRRHNEVIICLFLLITNKFELESRSEAMAYKEAWKNEKTETRLDVRIKISDTTTYLHVITLVCM